MTRDELDSALDGIIKDNLYLPFDVTRYYQVLAQKLSENAFELPDAFRGILLSMAAGLKKHALDDFTSDIRASMAVAKARGVTPALALVDHTFVIDVTFDPECNMWVGECEQIGLVTEAENYEALEQRALLIVGDLAIENGVMSRSETAQVLFQHQSVVA